MKKILIVSPMLPCGVTWLVNCFLELGIKAYRAPVSRGMWIKNGQCFFLNPSENELKIHLPALSRHKSFEFTDKIEVEWTHEWPLDRFRGCKIIYFIRDPRDAIYSWYRRLNLNLSYAQFVNMPDCRTLLDRINSWNLFNQFWCFEDQKEIKFFRFENYKKDALAQLNDILDYCGIRFSSEDVKKAIEQSTFDKAKSAEIDFRRSGGIKEKSIVNRAAKIGEWRSQAKQELEVSAEISRRTMPWLKRFGYEEQEAIAENSQRIFPSSYFNALAYFDTIIKPSEKALGNKQEFSVDELLISITRKIKNISVQDIIEYEKYQKFYGLTLLETLNNFKRRLVDSEKITICPYLAQFKKAIHSFSFIVLRSCLERFMHFDFKYFIDLGIWLIRRILAKFRWVFKNR